jgi:hypothetical protein
MEAVGFWPRGNEPCGRRRSGFGRPTGRILLFASKPRSVFVLPPPFDPGFGSRLASSSFRLVGNTEVSVPRGQCPYCLDVKSRGARGVTRS